MDTLWVDLEVSQELHHAEGFSEVRTDTVAQRGIYSMEDGDQRSESGDEDGTELVFGDVVYGGEAHVALPCFEDIFNSPA